MSAYNNEKKSLTGTAVLGQLRSRLWQKVGLRVGGGRHPRRHSAPLRGAQPRTLPSFAESTWVANNYKTLGM